MARSRPQVHPDASRPSDRTNRTNRVDRIHRVKERGPSAGCGLSLSPGVQRALTRDLAMHPDREIVALVAGPDKRHATAYLPAYNHAWENGDGAKGPGDDRFDVEGAEVARLLEAVWADGLAPVAWVHSHPNGRLTPSLRDREGAWPGLVTLIAGPGTFADGPVRLRAYRPARRARPGASTADTRRPPPALGPGPGGTRAQRTDGDPLDGVAQVTAPWVAVRCIRPMSAALGHLKRRPLPLPNPERTRRQAALPEIGETGQGRLARARVLVLGVGGLGTPAALYLSRTGLGTLGLSDGDTVEASNLGRQVLFGEPDVGQPKNLVAARRLQDDVGAGSRIQPERAITRAGAAALLARYDVIVHGTDLYSVRDWVNRVCVRLGIPWVDASVYRWTAQVTVYRPGGPCYRCLYPALPEEGAIDACDVAGVPGPVTGVAGTLEALEALKLVVGIKAADPGAGRLLLWDGLTSHFEEVAVHRRPRCNVCGHGAETPRVTLGRARPDRPTAPRPSRPAGDIAFGLTDDPAQIHARRLGLAIAVADAVSWPGPVFDLRPIEWQRRLPLPGSRSLPLPRVTDMLALLAQAGKEVGPPLLVCMHGTISAELALAVYPDHPDVRCLDAGVADLLQARDRLRPPSIQMPASEPLPTGRAGT